MKNICFFFQVHQPLRLKRYRFFEIGQDHYYYDDFQTEERLHNLVEHSILPTNKLILEMIKSSNSKFKCSFSISGVALEQFELYAPEVIDSFRELAKTGCVEFLAEPFAHSLACIYNTEEFRKQLILHAKKIEAVFGKKPTAVFNAEMIYSDEIGEIVSELGYKTMLIDQTKYILGWKSPNFIYTHSYLSKLKLLVRENKLSDDIAFRFSDPAWNEYPLTAEKFIHWISTIPEQEKLINLGFGYEVFGETQPGYTGIFDFLKALPYHAIEQKINFVLPSEISKTFEPAGTLSVPNPISWVGNDKDLVPWSGNDLQYEALTKLYSVAERVGLCTDKSLQHDWLMLQTTDHFRYMSHSDPFGTHFESSYDAFTNYMNILADFLDRVDAQYPTTIENEELNELLKTINHQEKDIARLEAELKKLRTRKKASADSKLTK